jgi:acetyl-CoA C-acetyltransferase
MASPGVAVVSTAQTEFRPAWDRAQHVDLIGAAVTRALEGIGLTMEDVDFVIDSGSDVLDGRSISNCGFLGAMGGHHKEESRVEEDGLWAAIYAATKLRSGPATVGLVVAYSKPSESDVSAYYATLCDPFYQRPVGLNQLVASGLAARAYLHSTGATEFDLATAAAADWAHAVANPRVELADSPDAESIAASDYVASPLRSYQVSRPVDGAVAVVLATEEIARRVTRTPVWITGMGAAMDSQMLSERAFGRFEACEAAAEQAFRSAGITSSSVFSLAEVSASSIAEELMVVESLGLADRGRGVQAYGGDSPVRVNFSGGALPADPIMATGLARLGEAVRGLLSSADGGRAVVHGSSGIGMQNHCVFTVEV